MQNLFKTLIFSILGLIIVLSLLSLIGLSPSPYDFKEINTNELLQAPSLQHLFGTDALGRDLFTRVIHGSSTSIAIAAFTALNAFIIGTIFGTIAAIKGGWIEELIIKIIDFIYSLPDLLVLSVIALFVSQSTSGIVFGLAFINWMDVARLSRAEMKRLKSEDYIDAAHVIGLSNIEIVFRHLLPNTMSSILVALSFTIPRAIISESTLSFIGLGLSPPDTSLGTLTGDAWQYLRTDPHLIIFPATVIFLLVFAFNIIGDNLQNKHQPRKIGDSLLAQL